MYCKSFPQYSIVTGDSAGTFSEKLNAELRRLASKTPAVTFSECDPFLARISYSEVYFEEHETSTAPDLDLRCYDCPYFEPIIKADGTEDRRVKYGACRFAEFGRTYKTTRACDTLYKMFKNGEVRLCLSE